MAAPDQSHWKPDAEVAVCHGDASHEFSFTERRHHCRECGEGFCNACTCYHTTGGKGGAAPQRACYACCLKLARVAQPGPPAESTAAGLSTLAPVDVGVNKEESHANVYVDVGDDATQAVTGQANAKVDFTDSYIHGGIVKGSNGHVKLTRCYVDGPVALDIGGNNTVELVDCIIVGDVSAYKGDGNAKMTAKNTWFISTDGAGAAIWLEKNGKATLTDCSVTGPNAYIGTSKINSVLNTTGGFVAGNTGKMPWSFLSDKVAIAGKAVTSSTTTVIGKVMADAKNRASAFDGVAKKAQAKATAKAKSMAKKEF